MPWPSRSPVTPRPRSRLVLRWSRIPRLLNAQRSSTHRAGLPSGSSLYGAPSRGVDGRRRAPTSVTELPESGCGRTLTYRKAGALLCCFNACDDAARRHALAFLGVSDVQLLRLCSIAAALLPACLVPGSTGTRALVCERGMREARRGPGVESPADLRQPFLTLLDSEHVEHTGTLRLIGGFPGGCDLVEPIPTEKPRCRDLHGNRRGGLVALAGRRTVDVRRWVGRTAVQAGVSEACVERAFPDVSLREISAALSKAGVVCIRSLPHAKQRLPMREAKCIFARRHARIEEVSSVARPGRSPHRALLPERGVGSIDERDSLWAGDIYIPPV